MRNRKSSRDVSAARNNTAGRRVAGWTLPGLAIVVLFAVACGAEARSESYPNTFEGLVECVYGSMEGSLTRPRAHPYADTPYLTDLDPNAAIVGGRITVSDEAWQHFEGLLKVSGDPCGGIRTYPISETGLAGRKALELQAVGVMFIVPLVGMLSPDMAHNCTIWQEELRPYKEQSSDRVGISKRVPERWQAYSAAWDRASNGIDQQCAAHGVG